MVVFASPDYIVPPHLPFSTIESRFTCGPVADLLTSTVIICYHNVTRWYNYCTLHIQAIEDELNPKSSAEEEQPRSLVENHLLPFLKLVERFDQLRAANRI